MTTSTTTTATAPDVVVVGGGVIGLAVAWQAQRSGLSITVVDEQPGRGASWAAAGMLAPVTEAHFGEETLLTLNLESARRYPSWVRELEEASGRRVGYRQAGTLMVARDADELAVVTELFEFQRSLGLEVTRLRARECRALEPGLSPRVRGGISVAGDHQVDNRALVTALMDACVGAGVRLVDERAEGILGGEKVEGVRLPDGESIACELAVVCAGATSGSISGLPAALAACLRPVKGQLVHLRSPRDAAPASSTIRNTEVYVVPRGDGRVVVGATVEERGFDDTVTAGGIYELLRGAYEILPGITELEVSEITAGLRPATLDNAPLIGPTEVKGLVVATGHFRNGILLAPATADGIAEYLTTGVVPDELAAFSPRRFDRTGVRS